MIEVGEYIRTEKGIISKINSGVDIDMLEFENAIIGNIKAHSKNIIDLIEVGDYVNGYEVMNIYKPRDIWEPIEIEIDSKCTRCFLASEIKSIVTKEQFNSVMYKVGDIE